MFLTHRTETTTKLYGRLLGKNLAKVAFISFDNDFFIHSFKRNGDFYNYQYFADYEFLRYLSALINRKIPEQEQVVILIEDLPTDVQTFLRMTPDLVAAFKCTREDLALDRLDKSALEI